MSKNFLLVIGFVVIVIIIVAAFYFTDNTTSITTDDMFFIATTTSEVTEARQTPEGWHEYRNERYHFSLLYPQELAVKEFDEGGGATTMIFQNPEEGQGFQIFIVPYIGQKISEQRFRRDAPSGVRKNPVDLQIDGVSATAFYSEHALYGETREIWLIHGGYLYELTTLKPLEGLLNEIVKTWKFIRSQHTNN